MERPKRFVAATMERAQRWRAEEAEKREIQKELRDRAKWDDSANRLRVYFFPEGLWEKLSEDSQNLLIVADRTWTFSLRDSMLRTALNPITKVAESILHYYLWIPLLEWAEKRTETKSALNGSVNRYALDGSFTLSKYADILQWKIVKEYLEVALAGSLAKATDLEFLTSPSEMPAYFKRLASARNAFGHEPEAVIDINRVRNLYEEALGVGQPGVLPTLLRLLPNGSAA